MSSRGSSRLVDKIAFVHLWMNLKPLGPKIDKTNFLWKSVQPVDRAINSRALLGIDIEAMVV